MDQSEVIIEVGAEGGSITLYGQLAPDGWRYSTSTLDQTPDLLSDEFDEPAIQRESKVVHSWETALLLMDRYPWHRLYPLTVHPEFRELVWASVQSRFASDGKPPDEGQQKRWRELCQPQDR